MSPLARALRTAAAAALISAFAVAGTGAAAADPGDAANSPDVGALAEAMSKGYTLDNCAAQQPTGTGELAELSCGQSPDANGPASAHYVLFDNDTNLASAFKSAIKGMSMTVCGDAGESPTTWRQGANGQSAGQVGCGTSANAATIVWTTDSKKVLGRITAADGDLDHLYQWWRTNG